MLAGLRTWAESFRGQNITIECDNETFVKSFKKRSCKNTSVNRIIQCIIFVMLKFKFRVNITHIKGFNNIVADAITRPFKDNTTKNIMSTLCPRRQCAIDLRDKEFWILPVL